MDIEQAAAIAHPAEAMAGLARRRLQRLLDAADEAHREAVSGRLAVSRYCAELDADVGEIHALAAAIAEAARRFARPLNRLAENNLSVPDDLAPLPASDLADRLEESLDGLLTPSAARLLGAAVAVELV